MKIFANKRSEAITIVLIVLIIAVFVGWLVNFSSRECRSNTDCDGGFYCGSDFACHQIPVVEKFVVKNNLIIPSIIMGISIIVSAIVLKRRKKPFSKKSNQETGQKPKNNNPPNMP